MRVFILCVLFLIVPNVLSADDVPIVQADCMKYGGTTVSCPVLATWSCAFPACHDFNFEGGNLGESWDAVINAFPNTGYYVSHYSTKVCYWEGDCYVVAFDPEDPENHTCVTAPNEFWFAHAYWAIFLNTDDPCNL